MQGAEHKHNWACLNDDKVVCYGCDTVTKLAALLEKTQNLGEAKGAQEAFDRCIKNGWLTPAARSVIMRSYDFQKERVANAQQLLL